MKPLQVAGDWSVEFELVDGLDRLQVVVVDVFDGHLPRTCGILGFELVDIGGVACESDQDQ